MPHTNKVLLAQETYLPLIGGAEMHVFYLAQHLIALGFEVELITGTAARHEGGDGDAEFPVHRHPVSSGLRDLALLPVWLWRFARLARGCRVIHAHYSAYFAFVAVLTGFILRKRVVVTLHGLGTLDSSVGRSWARRLYRAVALRHADAIVATSQEMKDVARRFAPDSRIVIIENGVDTERFTPHADRTFTRVADVLRLSTLRRLVPKNGVHFVVQALGIGKERLRFALRIIGDGRLRTAIEETVRDHGLTDLVTMAGTKEHHEVRQLLEETDVTVFLSTAESTSLAALESMAMGCLVLCSNAGAFPDFVRDGETGFMVDLFTPGVSDYGAPETLEGWQYSRIIDKLAAIQAMPADELARISRNAQAFVREHYDWARITARTVVESYGLDACAEAAVSPRPASSEAAR
jgi:glycosyltransferase involved in cell wall biosynthesis